jgi:ABC-type glycerol-3-phosphate transport system substrate-binding protein
MVVLPRGGKNPDLAFELARTAAGPEGQTKMFQVLSQYPSFKDFYQSREFAEGVRQDPVVDVVPKLHATGKAYPFFRRYNDSNRDAGPLLADAVEGKLDHRQALLEAERKINAVLAGP